jgi:hypothetical protein
MPTFRDRKDKEWNVEMSVDLLKEVRLQTEFNLLTLLDNEMVGLAQLHDDPEVLVGVLFAVLEEQIDAEKMTPEQFGRCFAGDSIRDAAAALVEAVADFYPSLKQRKILRAMNHKIMEGVEYHLAKIEEIVEGLTIDEIREGIDRQFASAEPTPS